ncbi:UBX domain-containing protein 1 [Protopterus annectens]|uniref:UBX domain-containing protein 1 n=1 Tax=Protopterus annectens TaxID=7888 RepID=UPI001CFADC0A|nr:UBX domain-containing protein 1 [Protopterus annectens]XP_043931576.1 UBX domain-containing protein 1 [Protopterus annectens]
MADCTTLDSLLEMGFSRNRALMEHENDPDIDEPYVPPAGNVLGSELPDDVTEDPMEIAEGCDAEGEDNAVAKRPLTEEEKQQQIKRLEELMAQKQHEREEREKREAVEREKQRRKQGQELSVVRQKMQEDEMKKIVEERRREKMEEKLAKQRVREKIERDKADRARKFGMGESVPSSSPVEATSVPPSVCQEPLAKKEYDECRLQIRLLDGSTMTQTFKAKEQLAAVRLYVDLNRKDGATPFNFMTSFPRRMFAEEDMEKPLQELGLVPSAVLIVIKK